MCFLQKFGKEVNDWSEERYVHVLKRHALMEEASPAVDHVGDGMEVIKLRERHQHSHAREQTLHAAKAELGRLPTVCPTPPPPPPSLSLPGIDPPRCTHGPPCHKCAMHPSVKVSSYAIPLPMQIQ